jgi:hypothetical protein
LIPVPIRVGLIGQKMMRIRPDPDPDPDPHHGQQLLVPCSVLAEKGDDMLGF